MTEFTKCSNAVDDIEAGLRAMADDGVPVPAKKAALDKCKELSEEFEPRILKLKKKADEKDPGKQIYGEAMVTKVLALYERFDEASTHVADVEATVISQYKPFEAAKREEAAKAALMTQEEQLKRAERLRQIEAEAAAADEQRRQEAAQAEVDRQRRYEEALEAAAKAQEELEVQHEEEKKEREEIEQYLNSTPSRQLLRTGVLKLHANCMAKGKAANRDGLRDFDDSIRSLHVFVKNLAGHPDSMEMKHMRYSNENFAKEIMGRGEGCLEVLYSLGYRPAGFGESRFLILEEIDPINRYKDWEMWWDEIKWTRDYLEGLTDSMRNHRRGVATGEYDIMQYLPIIKGTRFDVIPMQVPVIQSAMQGLYS
ncbi:hypothetical protein DIPPA_19155 [Diplonema papillatum]|nr:hypothetical protein DIPPA_19155 [Diplonema papillatum]